MPPLTSTDGTSRRKVRNHAGAGRSKDVGNSLLHQCLRQIFGSFFNALGHVAGPPNKCRSFITARYGTGNIHGLAQTGVLARGLPYMKMDRRHRPDLPGDYVWWRPFAWTRCPVLVIFYACGGGVFLIGRHPAFFLYFVAEALGTRSCLFFLTFLLPYVLKGKLS